MLYTKLINITAALMHACLVLMRVLYVELVNIR